MEQQHVQNNFYALLGVPRNASVEEINEAYQSRMQNLLDEDRQALDRAYQTLSKPEERKSYDESLPKGIYYFEATQAFDWSDTQSQDSEETTELAYHQVNEVVVENEPDSFDDYIDLSKQLADFAPDSRKATQGNLSKQALHPNFSRMGGFGATVHQSKEEQDYLSQYHGRRGRSQHDKQLSNVRGIKTDFTAIYTEASIHEMIVKRAQYTNRLLLAIGLGAPMLTLLGCIAYLLRQ